MIIGGFQKSSLIDFPEKISAIIFTKGCNFRCPYCHNPELFEGTSEGVIPTSDVLSFLKRRRGKLDGVVITGGEPTLQKDLCGFIKELKSLSFEIKLDTNGTNSKVLNKLVTEKLVDYVAMDIKAPIEKYADITCSKVKIKEIEESVNFLLQNKVDYEFRTTVVKKQLDFEDFEGIGKLICGAKKYYLQRFLPTKTLDVSFLKEETYSDEDFDEIKLLLQDYVEFVDVR